MGRMKDQMMEEDGRGWRDIDGYVCEECVEDDYLKKIVKEKLISKKCTFCDKRSRKNIACDANELMPLIASAVFYSYADPVSAGVPYDDGLVDEGEFTPDMLAGLPLECNDNFFEAVSKSFVNDMWVEAPEGAWASSHNDDILSYSWNSFVKIIKHKTRFNFNVPSASEYGNYGEIEPHEVLKSIGEIAREQRLVRKLDSGVKLYRTRNAAGDWEVNSESMGAPPENITRAGRMNPAGISYLYCAFDEETAMAETIPLPPVVMNLATFEVSKKMNVLDLTKIPDIPSIFESVEQRTREAVLFLYHFVHDISRPVRKDGGEHIDYVPSQVVSEWFAQVFKFNREGDSLDGIIYPSAIAPGGVNLVVFPDHSELKNTFHKVEYISNSVRNFSDWQDVVRAMKKIGG